MAFVKPFAIKRYPSLYRFIQNNRYGKFLAEKNFKKCYDTLEIAENSDQEEVRSAYLKLVKKYHPDSGTPSADSNKFQEIDQAFRILINKQCKERWDIEEIKVENIIEEHDIKHTAPQHRQYLNFDGMGIGTPFQREKQFTKIRAMHAAENVMNHRLQKASADDKALMDKKSQTHKIKTKYGFDRLVEDLIQESMSKGEFDNLSGRGKPLPQYSSTNPYIDFVTHKLNQVLIDNGFTPEWIMLQKEIRHEKRILLRNLYKDRSALGKYPFDDIDNFKWEKIVNNYVKDTEEINRKTEKYNLLVPILQKQMFLFSLEKEATKIANIGQTKSDIEFIEKSEINEAQKNPQNIFSFFESFFVRNK